MNATGMRRVCSFSPNRISLYTFGIKPLQVGVRSRFCSTTATNKPVEQFRIVGATIVERPQVVLRAAKWELEWSFFQTEVEEHREKMREEVAQKKFEVELAERQKLAKAAPKKKSKDKDKGKEKVVVDQKKKDDIVFEKKETTQTTEEEEEAYPLITPDDTSNNRKSLYRKLTEKLYLIVKKPRDQFSWQFPQGGAEVKDGNNLRTTAEREFKEECGDTIRVFYVGYKPLGFYMYELPAEAKKKYAAEATKVFYYKALYVNGTPTLNKNELVDYLWVTRTEMAEYFEPKYYNYIKNILFDDAIHVGPDPDASIHPTPEQEIEIKKAKEEDLKRQKENPQPKTAPQPNRPPQQPKPAQQTSKQQPPQQSSETPV